MSNDNAKEIVMFNSPSAAGYRTGLSGWVARGGIYFGDGPGCERNARYAGCTHVACSKCGAPTPKSRTLCQDCNHLADLARYEAMPRVEWDGLAMLYSEARDNYYISQDAAEDELEPGETLADLRLVICTPNYASPLDEDYFCDELPEDGELPEEVADAVAAFNRSVNVIVLSWSPGKFALALPGAEGVHP